MLSTLPPHSSHAEKKIQITCSEIVSETILGPQMSVILGKVLLHVHTEVANDRRLCITTQQPLSIKFEDCSQK